LRAHDWIVALSGVGVATVDDLQRILAKWTPGEPLAVTVLRNGGHRHELVVIPSEDAPPARVAN
jgi:S1-C subfamily serine protease